MGIRKPLFDRKFGHDFIATVPSSPGVYEMLDGAGTTIYVGKAKRLRRRLQQYRNARRCKTHHKMRAILSAAHALRLTPCGSDLDALLLENRLIQKLRPRFNVAGAFSFLYPMIGLERRGSELALCYSSSPSEFGMFEFYGAFRSRLITREAFLALLALLEHIGHREPRKKLSGYPHVKFSIVARYRQIGDQWLAPLERFLRGDSPEFLEQAVLALVDKPSARRHADEVQEYFDQLARFYRHEAKALRQAMQRLGLSSKSISQEERDRVFLSARHARQTAQALRRIKPSEPVAPS